MIKISDFKYKRPKIPFFASWAIIKRADNPPKHYLNGKAICYNAIQNTAYANHIEMAGFFCSAIISYGIGEKGNLKMMRHVIFPQLRLHPNNTHSSLDHNFKGITLKINNVLATETVDKIVFDGIINIYSHCGDIAIERKIFAARNSKACVEKLQITNKGTENTIVEAINNDKQIITSRHIGADNRRYRLYAVIDNRVLKLGSGKSESINIAYCGANLNEEFVVDCCGEYLARCQFINNICDKLVITTPDDTLNTMLFYAKIRAAESIFATKSGLMHSPGGGGFYAAMWTNDQCEYVNPLFGYFGYAKGIEQSLNCYNLYKKYISKDSPLITSIIAEGDSIWHGVGDRGDSAMYAYGCSRFLMSLGDKSVAGEYMPYIRDCISYTLSKINASGVVASDSDELENRFESGSANLCTSCLAYDALISVSYLEREFGNTVRANELVKLAEKLAINIEKYFGKNVEGYDTYRYCEEEHKLRSWIALPLSVGIFNRAEATVKALLSPLLRKKEGLLTRSGEKTFWDRSTLYALRGMFNAGLADNAIEFLQTYSQARLLGAHIPYAVEAYPEGNQAQLSAESGLYIRIFTEGILGYRPTGFGVFKLAINLPQGWQSFKVENFFTCGKLINITVNVIDGETEVVVGGAASVTKTGANTVEVRL